MEIENVDWMDVHLVYREDNVLGRTNYIGGKTMEPRKYAKPHEIKSLTFLRLPKVSGKYVNTFRDTDNCSSRTS